MFDAFTEPKNLVALFTAVGVFASILVIVMPMLAKDNLGTPNEVCCAGTGKAACP